MNPEIMQIASICAYVIIGVVAGYTMRRTAKYWFYGFASLLGFFFLRRISKRSK